MCPRLAPSIFIILLSIFQCNSCHINRADISTPSINSYNKAQSPISICGFEGFTELADEHMLYEIKQPFIVQKIKGKIINADDYGWEKDIRVLFEIRGIEKDRQVRKIYAGENGDFIMNNIPEGRYCFKATVLGWQSVMGIIIVSKKADPRNEIVFTMRWD